MSRPVYIPPAKRRKASQQQSQQTKKRFHGAFTGGFSAGYFNTVDTKEGWKPSTKLSSQPQRMEDFMDDQDHEEWGGPTTVRQDYKGKSDTQDAVPQTEKEPHKETTLLPRLESVFTVSHHTVGPRLLRQLGWREGASSAFVPAVDNNEATADRNSQTTEMEDTELRQAVSIKRLKQIRLQSSRVVLPPPKLDACGLGFEALENAPEFRRYREQRQHMARERARGPARDAVYRTSDLALSNDTARHIGGASTAKDASNGEYVSYETAEDFVGTRSASGFALRDDEDDAYDTAIATGDKQQGSKPSQLQMETEYNNEAYEPDDQSDEEEQLPHLRAQPSAKKSTMPQANVFAAGLAAWTGGANATTNPQSGAQPIRSKALASNGRPPVAGFRLGGSMESLKKRYPGPDIPRDYLPQAHVFGINERPEIFQVIANAVQLEEKRQAPIPSRQATKPSTSPLPLGGSGNQFAGLAAAMKSRFTSGKSTTQTGQSNPRAETMPAPKVGLYHPPPASTFELPPPPTGLKPPGAPPPTTVSRTVRTFSPNPLACKRFGVPAPQHSQSVDAGAKSRLTEATYFEKEVLSSARENARSKENGQQGASTLQHTRTNAPTDANAREDTDDKSTAEVVRRPDMEKLKSIFEPSSDVSSEESDDTDLDSLDETGRLPEKATEQGGGGEDAVPLPGNATDLVESDGANQLVEHKSAKDEGADESSSATMSSQSRDRRERKRKRHKHKRSSSRRKRTKSSRATEDSDREATEDESDEHRSRRRRERRKKGEKKRRKKPSHRKRSKDDRV